MRASFSPRGFPVAFLALLGRILPMQVAGDPKRPLSTVNEVKITIVDPKAHHAPDAPK